jgi:hypothetical protein
MYEAFMVQIELLRNNPQYLGQEEDRIELFTPRTGVRIGTAWVN